jgi:hypothetical protein
MAAPRVHPFQHYMAPQAVMDRQQEGVLHISWLRGGGTLRHHAEHPTPSDQSMAAAVTLTAS